MTTFLKKNLTSNTVIKVISFIIGYGVWSFFGNARIIQKEVHVPICFYNENPEYAIQSPESIAVLVEGKRSDIYQLDLKQLAVHIDAASLKNGINLLAVTEKQLFLPDTCKVVYSTPLPMMIELHTTQG